MLSYRTVYPETLGLLKKLMKHPQLSDFFLVGGTALALQMGHRISIWNKTPFHGRPHTNETFCHNKQRQ